MKPWRAYQKLMNLCKDAWSAKWILDVYIYWLYTVKVYIYFMKIDKMSVLVIGSKIHWYWASLVEDTKKNITSVLLAKGFCVWELEIDVSVNIPWWNVSRREKLLNGWYDLVLIWAIAHKNKWIAGNIEYIHPNLWTCTKSKWPNKHRSLTAINKSNLRAAIYDALWLYFVNNYDIDINKEPELPQIINPLKFFEGLKSRKFVSNSEIKRNRKLMKNQVVADVCVTEWYKVPDFHY